MTCGACCFSELNRYVRVTGDDYSRLGERAEELAWFDDDHRAYLKMADGHCASLRLDHDSGRFFCQIYEARPDVCRELARGSGQCNAERHYKAEGALLTLRKTREA